MVAKVDVRNAHNEVWSSTIITTLKSEPTLQHLAWFATVVLTPSTGLETGGVQWGEQGEGETQGDTRASPFFASAIHPAVKCFHAELSVAGGGARFRNDYGYGCRPPDVVFPALAHLEVALWEECGLTLQRQKTVVLDWRDLPPGTPVELKRPREVIGDFFQPSFDCYGTGGGNCWTLTAALRGSTTAAGRFSKGRGNSQQPTSTRSSPAPWPLVLLLSNSLSQGRAAGRSSQRSGRS